MRMPKNKVPKGAFGGMLDRVDFVRDATGKELPVISKKIKLVRNRIKRRK